MRVLDVSHLDAVATCDNCGCTDMRACPGGCSWLAVNRHAGTGICSRCPKSLATWRAQYGHVPSGHGQASVDESLEIEP